MENLQISITATITYSFDPKRHWDKIFFRLRNKGSLRKRNLVSTVDVSMIQTTFVGWCNLLMQAILFFCNPDLLSRSVSFSCHYLLSITYWIIRIPFALKKKIVAMTIPVDANLNFWRRSVDFLPLILFLFIQGSKWRTHVDSIITNERMKSLRFFLKRSRFFFFSI